LVTPYGSTANPSDSISRRVQLTRNMLQRLADGHHRT
jgi:hypothetical protein